MSWIEKYDVRIPMRDGVRLACDLRMPDHGGPFPVVLLRTPYNKDIQPGPRLENLTLFLNAGFAMAIMDVRGKYESEGEFPVLSLEQEGQDGFDTIDWLSRRPWCNGQVVMTGASYCGYTQLYAAALRPPALCGITPGVFGTDGFRNITRRNGVIQMSLLVWALRYSTGRVAKNPLVDWGALCQSVPLVDIPARCGLDVPAFHLWLEHNTDSAFWHHLGHPDAIASIAVPALLTGGWYDIYSSAVLEAFTWLRSQPGMRDRIKVVIGPWPHGMGGRETGELDFGPNAELQVVDLGRQWLERCVRGNDFTDWPPVRLFVTGVNRWLETDDWPPLPQSHSSLLLAADAPANTRHGGGRLAATPGALTEDHFDSDPARPVPNRGGNILSLNEQFSAGPFDQQKIEQRPDLLIYTGPELTAPQAVIGTPRAELWVSSSAPDSDWIVRLCDVYPDGRSFNLSTGILRARYREGLDREVLMQPGSVYRLTVELDSLAHVFLPGHRLRLEIAGSSFPQFARNHQTGGDNYSETEFRIAHQTVFHSDSCPSRLELPVYEGKI